MSETSLARLEAIHAFLAAAGWQDATETPLQGDASTRRYIRISKGARSAMLMDQPQHAESPNAGVDAGPEERKRLGYNAVARLAGADCARFVAVASHLRALGLSAPDVLAADTENGFLLLEDFKDNLYSDALKSGALNSGANEEELYAAAIDALVAVHLAPAPSSLGKIPFFEYDDTALLAETDLLTEWFLPLALGRSVEADERSEHRRLWKSAIAPVLRAPSVFVHRDYHAQNLIWIPERSGVARVGMIDFQDAVAGHSAYDLISLLEDARRDVSSELADAMTARFLARSSPDINAEEFLSAKSTMAAQRNAKIVGIFARLAKRDGKPSYLSHLPRVWSYLERDLESPALEKLRAWYERMVPRESRMKGLRGQGDRE